MAMPPQARLVGSERKICMLVYGASGSGKTVLAGGSPECLILRPPTDHTASLPAGSAHEWIVRDWSDMMAALDYVLNRDPAPDSWIWLDSVSLWQDHGLDDIWQDVIADKPARSRNALDKGEYGVNMFRLGSWVRAMVAAPGFNFGITAHPAELRADDDEPSLMPWLQGRNMATKVCGYMNLVGYLQVVARANGQEGRVLYTKPFARGPQSAPVYAKDQYDCLPEGRLLNPTMAKLLAAINQKRK